MKIDLLDIFNKNKKLNEAQDKLELIKELRVLLSTIVKGDDEFLTNNETLIKKIGLKYKNNETLYVPTFSGYDARLYSRYKVELSKSNIKKVQSYLDDLEEEL